MTARWVVEEVVPHRDLDITWQPISLMFKNDVAKDSENYDAVYKTHQMLRVMEAIRADLGADAVQQWYRLCGTTIHHDRRLDEADFIELLDHLGLDPDLAAAADDERWDKEIRTRMDQGLELAGNDIGTPIIALENSGGDKQGYFGPVITRVPPGDQSLKMWDALTAMMDVAGFWELKRTRTEGPEFGDRPDV
ncbi:MAG: disulfide bond formation protein DsbA [Ilumatobacteraceae bacterium]